MIYKLILILKYWLALLIFISPAYSQVQNVYLSEKLFYIDFDSYEGVDNIYKKGFDKKDIGNFGFGEYAVWSRQTFENTGNMPMDIVLYNPRPGVDFIDVYIYRNGVLKDQRYIGHFRPIQNREFHIRFSAFGLKLLPNEKTEVLIRHCQLPQS